MVWNVKKLMPMGITSWVTGMVTLKTVLTVSVKKPRYLYTHSTARFDTIASTSQKVFHVTEMHLSIRRPNM